MSIFVPSCIVLTFMIFRLKIFPVSESCPILTGNVSRHHPKSPGSSNNTNGHLSPVVNEKSPQSIIMEAPLASLGKKSTICTSNGGTTAKYWRRLPSNVSGNILGMEDRRGLRSLGGSSTCISDHPYSEASCTSSPVYAELDPSVAGSCHTPPIIGAFQPYGFAQNNYTDVPDALRAHLSSSLLTDSSTYDNAAYLSAASTQPFLNGSMHNSSNSSRSLRRLATAQRAANGQVATPLLGHPYHFNASNGGVNSGIPGQFHYLTGGRQLKKPRPGQTMGNIHHSTPNGHFNSFRIGPNATLVHTGTIGGSRLAGMNHYVTHDETDAPPSGGSPMVATMLDDHSVTPMQFSSFLENVTSGVGRKLSMNGNGGNGPPQYTEMPLLNASPFGSTTYRGMHDTHSSHDLCHSSASSSSGGGGGNGTNATNSSSATSTASLKRPLPPVPAGVRL